MVPTYFNFLKSFNLQGASLYFSLLLILLFGVSACLPAASAAELTPVTVQLSWSHQAEFAGFYAAEQQGYFHEEGLKVTFLEGGPEVDFIKPVADGRAQFGIAQPADLILARAAGTQGRLRAGLARRSAARVRTSSRRAARASIESSRPAMSAA